MGVNYCTTEQSLVSTIFLNPFSSLLLEISQLFLMSSLAGNKLLKMAISKVPTYHGAYLRNPISDITLISISVI